MTTTSDHNSNEDGQSYDLLEPEKSSSSYKQELFRGITGWFMNFAFTFTATGIISSYSIYWGNGLLTGGPVIMVWGWVIGSFFTIIVGSCMAEICSAYPQAGSVYFWTGMLANDEWAPLFSYLCGWANFVGNTASNCAFAQGLASLFVASLQYWGIILHPNWTVVGGIIVLSIWSAINILRIDRQGWVSNFAAFYQVVSSLVIIITVLSAKDQRAPADFVFTEFYNGTGFENSEVYVLFLGLLTTLFTFSGYDAGGHIAEETHQAHQEAPRGILVTVVSASIMGFCYVLGLLFAIPGGNIDKVLAGCEVIYSNFTGNSSLVCTSASGSGYALMNLFEYAIGPTGGFALTVLVIINIFFAGIASVTVTGRIGYAMARDGAFPGSEFLKQLDENTKSPVRIIFFTYLLGVTLLLLQLINSAAFTAIVSITTIGLQISYSLPIWMRITIARNTFVPSTFSLGRYSLVMGWLAAIWLTFTSLLFFWPFQSPVTAANMNYTVLVVGILVIIASFFWVFSARHWFRGPQRAASTLTSQELY